MHWKPEWVAKFQVEVRRERGPDLKVQWTLSREEASLRPLTACSLKSVITGEDWEGLQKTANKKWSKTRFLMTNNSLQNTWHTFIKSPESTLAAETILIRTCVSISQSDSVAGKVFWGSGRTDPRGKWLLPLMSSTSTWSEERSTSESTGLTPLDTQVRMY